jgi:hypothetical protein
LYCIDFLEPIDALVRIKYNDIHWKSTIKYNSATPLWLNEMFVGFIHDRVSIEVSLHEWKNEWNCKVCQ